MDIRNLEVEQFSLKIVEHGGQLHNVPLKIMSDKKVVR